VRRVKMGDSSNAQAEKKNWAGQGARRANSGSQVSSGRREGGNSPNNSRNQGRQNGTAKHMQGQTHNNDSGSNQAQNQTQNQLRNSSNKQGKKFNNNKQRAKKPRPGGPLSQEVQRKVADLRQRTNEYFPEEEILNVLKEHNYDRERALQVLVDKRKNSWSSVVLKAHTPFPSNGSAQPAPTQSTAAPPASTPPQQEIDHQAPPAAQQPKKGGSKGRKQKKGNQDHQQYQEVQKEGDTQQLPKTPKEQFNADAKIANLEELVAKDLSVIENKAQHLKNLREELRSVKAERDAQINALNTEKESLIAKREQIERELVETKQRVIEIDASVKHLQQEKDQKIKTLEEKYQHAILGQ